MSVWLVYLYEPGGYSVLRDVFATYEAAKDYCNKKADDGSRWVQGSLYMSDGDYYHIEGWKVRD